MGLILSRCSYVSSQTRASKPVHSGRTYGGGMTPTRRTMTWMSVWLVGGMAVSLAALAIGGTHGPDWLFPLALTVAAVSLGGPVVLLGWMLGRTVARGAGVLGVLSVCGLVTAAAGQAFAVTAAIWGGWGATATGFTGLILIGCRHRIVRSWRRSRARRAQARKARTVARLRRRTAKTDARSAARRAAREPADADTRR